MSYKTQAARQEAAEYLEAVETLARSYGDNTDKADFSGTENLFSHLGVLARAKYGEGGHLSVGLINMGLTCLCYFQGRVDEGDFQGLRSDLSGLIKQLLNLTNPSNGTMH